MTSGGEPHGPDSLAVAKDGTVFVLDGLEQSIEVSQNQLYVRTIDLSFAVEPVDMVMAPDGTLWVLDMGRSPWAAYQVNQEGKLMKSHFIPEAAQPAYARGLSVDASGNVLLLVGGTEELLVKDLENGPAKGRRGQTPPRGKVRYTVTGARGNGRVTGNGRDVSVPFQGSKGGILLLGEDLAGNLHTEVVDLAEGPRAAGEITVRKYSAKGQLQGIVGLPVEEWGYVPRTRITALGSDSQVYALLPGTDSIRVMRAVYGKEHQSRFGEIRAQVQQEGEDLQMQLDAAPVNALASIGPAITESEAKTRAMAMINLSWTFAEENRTPNISGWVAPPDWLSGAATGTKTSIPYNWGGFDGTDRSSQPAYWSNFVDAMNQGKFAGNVYDSGGYKSGTAGIDCSGFVSAAWKFSYKVGTWALQYDSTITKATTSIRPMDIMVSDPYHVVFFNGGDQVGAYTLEATTSGEDKAHTYTRTWSWLSQNNYVYRQYVNLTH